VKTKRGGRQATPLFRFLGSPGPCKAQAHQDYDMIYDATFLSNPAAEHKAFNLATLNCCSRTRQTVQP